MKRGLKVALVMVCAFGAAAAAASGSQARTAMIRLNQPPRLAGAAWLGALPAATLVHLDVALKPRTGLAAFAAQVSDPASPGYRRYITPAQFGLRFGASAGQLAAVEASLRAHGLQPGPLPADRLSIPVTASAAAVEHAFSVSLERVRLASGRRAVVPSAAPALDAAVAPDVQAVVGLSSLYAPRPLALPGSPRGRRASAHVATGGPQPCSAASAAGTNAGSYTADQIASAYRFSGLYGAGNQGQGQTIALYELEPDDPTDIATYQSCYGTSTKVQYVPVDGGAGSGAGAGEAVLDIEMVIGLAPKATVLVYQGPNSSGGTAGSGPYDTFSAIFNQDRAQAVSTSWGDCESDVGQAVASAESNLFEQAAAQGQAVIAAAGDLGAEDCADQAGTPLPTPAVDDPGSQPYVTSVGGTTLSALGPPPSESVWNGGGSALALAGASSGATGGGVSQLWKLPAYQARAAGGLGIVQANSSGAPCQTASGVCREVPDVSADADPGSGYVIYYNGTASDPTATAGWQTEGGTSAASPLWAALIALSNGSSACHGSPVGFANPTLYDVASAAYGANFNDVTSGNNDYTGTNGGRFPAGSGYDMATGLGTPNATALAGAMCPAAFRVTNPGGQASRVGQKVAVSISTSDHRAGLSFQASGLPPGLTLNRATGRITGRARKAGTYTVVVLAANADGALRATGFVWKVQGGSVSCPGFAYRGSRILSIRATGITCAGARSLIPAAYRATGARRGKLGSYVAVRNGWRCTVLRPYRQQRHSYQNADCKAPGRHLSWKSRR